MKQVINFTTGTRVIGKWHHSRYTIDRKLGEGTVGVVYLAHVNHKYVALKISDQTMSMTVEVNVLKSLGKVQEKKLGPSLIDVDDFIAKNGDTYSFYVMEYIKGLRPNEFIHKRGKEWIGVFLLQLLDDLTILHHAGWVLGDLKMDNLIVALNPPRLRWIDVGGTTQMGRSIKEYTAFYDRGYWQMGPRRAEPSYDLFALVMVFLNIYYPHQFKKRGYHGELTKRLQDVDELTSYQPVLTKALQGIYHSSAEMKTDVLQLFARQGLNAGDHSFVRGGDISNVGHNQRKVQPIKLDALGLLCISLLYYLSSLFLI